MLSFVLAGKDSNEWTYFEQQWRRKQQFPWLYAMHECIFQYSWQWWACFTCMSEVRSLSRRWSNTTSTQLEWEKEKVNIFFLSGSLIGHLILKIIYWNLNHSPCLWEVLLFQGEVLLFILKYLRIFNLKVAEVKPLTKQWSL